MLSSMQAPLIAQSLDTMSLACVPQLQLQAPLQARAVARAFNAAAPQQQQQQQQYAPQLSQQQYYAAANVATATGATQ